MKKNDKEKLLSFIERLTDGYVYCFNREYSNAYMTRFLNMKWSSVLYNNEIGRLRLTVLTEQGIEDTSDMEENDERVEEVKTFFMREMKKMFKEKLPKHFEKLDEIKKLEKQREDEAKGKVKDKKKNKKEE